MHYYQHHIGDFIKDTANLDDHQLATYLRMIWTYYTDEKPINSDIEDLAFALRSDDKTVRLLLRHYFIETPEGWSHGRCDREISVFHDKSEKAVASAKARWGNAKAKQSLIERNANASIKDANEHFFDANQEPRTKNQEPIKNTVSASAPPDGVSYQVWGDFIKSRKVKLTKTALDGIMREADKAGWRLEDALRECCSRGWRGFKASWVEEKQSSETNYQRSMREKYQTAAPSIAASNPSAKRIDPNAFFDSLPPNTLELIHG